MRSYRFLLLFFSWLAVQMSLPSCASYRAAWNSGWTEKEANDSIMIVRESPPTLGWKRLRYFSTLHPEFGPYLAQMGTPDCIAESTHARQHYLIAYYLDRRQAFSFRNNTRAVSQPIEVAGPYPITRKEFRLLNDLKQSYDRTSRSR
jgi:hypothetical protein